MSRALAACEGALLVVDASQGVEAQTLANVYQAIDNNLEIVPVLNKIDLPAAEPEQAYAADRGRDRPRCLRRDSDFAPRPASDVDDVLEAIVQRLPPPQGRCATRRCKALLVDSWYDAYLGVVVLVRVVDGKLKQGPEDPPDGHRRGLRGRARRRVHAQSWSTCEELGPGEVGFFTAAIKEVADTRVGDTITDDKRPDRQPLPGFRPAQPVVFCGPVSGRCRRLRGAARRAGQAAPQRRELHLRDGDFGGAGLRLPLRLPRPAAPGDHPGAAGARVQPRPDHHRALASIYQHHADRRHR